ncbi:glycosyltransferase family 2 protein [Trabulsiella odontotermitis]|uniref:Glycosyl transferase family 2 n=1 Tax=Trabulsiella odontotermitis TaxID=379893 RepID=A0A0L0H019_9ENTR|nr:glycosyltransferase family 2 protein [Trabulsiella odontotermitis]KNC94291.1 glycosyl transferase family 2 [Trabulsiella odontotermitis]
MPFLSVIIAAHNSDTTLPATLESLSSALGKAKDTEVIILNDSSTDNTQGVIDEWRTQLTNVLTEQVEYHNIGKVRQHAISLASGNYITMLDSDDLLKPQSLQDAINFLQEQQPDMLLSRLLEIRDLSKITSDWHGFSPKNLTTHEAIRRFLIHKDFQAHLIGQFVRRDLYLQSPIPPLSCYEDFAIFPKMLANARRITYQRDGHYYYIKRPNSLSSALDASKITHLVDCTLSMEQVFPPEFQHLMNCHWFNIWTNHKQRLTPLQLETVKSRINKVYSLAFFLSKDIRFSYKKRALKELWKK